ncbi:MAG: hypothetical protein QXN55_01430 [Candidatus Nitrosotenuis sp.]
MPNAVVKSFARKSGKSIKDVEKIWDETKKEVKDRFKDENPFFWAYVNKVVQKKLGISESHTLSSFLLETNCTSDSDK